MQICAICVVCNVYFLWDQKSVFSILCQPQLHPTDIHAGYSYCSIFCLKSHYSPHVTTCFMSCHVSESKTLVSGLVFTSTGERGQNVDSARVLPGEIAVFQRTKAQVELLVWRTSTDKIPVGLHCSTSPRFRQLLLTIPCVCLFGTLPHCHVSENKNHRCTSCCMETGDNRCSTV